MLEAMEISSYTTKIRLAAFQLEGEAQVWWKWERTSRDLEAMTWAEFHTTKNNQITDQISDQRPTIFTDQIILVRNWSVN